MTAQLDEKRQALLLANVEAWNRDPSYFLAAKLDSSLKKNTAFIKKVRTGLSDNHAILRDIETLSLEKYLTEIVSACSEALLRVAKGDDVMPAVEVVSALHQRFSTQFTPFLLANVLSAVVIPSGRPTDDDSDKDDLVWALKLKNLVRLVAELCVVGVFRTVKDCPRDLIPDLAARRLSKVADELVVVYVLKDVLNYDIKLGATLVVVQVVLKRFHHIILGKSSLLEDSVKNTLQHIFRIYTKAVFQIVTDLHRKKLQLEKRNAKAAIRTGRILEEVEIALNETTRLFEKFKTNSEYLCSILDLQMPQLDTADDEDDQNASVVELVKNADEDLKFWEDIKEKNFYTKVPTLGDLIGPEAEKKPAEDLSSGERINDFLARLEKVTNEKETDLLAVEFCQMQLNNKATKNRIYKFFMEISNIDSLKFYTRFLKIHLADLHDVIKDLVEYLDKGFRSQIHHDKINFKNIFFFIEFVKFKMIPTHVIFHKIRRLTMDIADSNNIDILSVLYERVGLFLLNEADYRDLTIEMIELLKQKLKNDKLQVNDKLAIKNLLLIIDPPATKAARVPRQRLTVEEEFLFRIVRHDLNEQTFPIVKNLLSKVDLASSKVARKVLLEIFSAPEQVNYDNLKYLAEMLVYASTKDNSLLIMAIDTVVDKVVRGLELNDYRLNRSRISQVKYLAELHNSQVLDFKFVTDILYKILCFGHPNSQPLPMNYAIAIDAPDNYFRVQLCCVLLNSLKSLLGEKAKESKKSGSKLKRIRARNKVRRDKFAVFWAFFEYYGYCKKQPLPVEVEFQRSDAYYKYSSIYEKGLDRPADLKASVASLSEIIQQQGFDKNAAIEEEEDDEDEEDEEEDEEEGSEDTTIEIESDGSDDEEEDDSSESEDDDSDAGSVVSKNSRKVGEKEGETDSDSSDDDSLLLADELDYEERKFEDSMDREFERMMSESLAQGRSASGARSKFNVPLPAKLADRNASSGINRVSFGLLTRLNKESTVKLLSLPSDSQFVETVLREQEKQKNNRERIMSLVRNMDD